MKVNPELVAAEQEFVNDSSSGHAENPPKRPCQTLGISSFEGSVASSLEILAALASEPVAQEQGVQPNTEPKPKCCFSKPLQKKFTDHNQLLIEYQRYILSFQQVMHEMPVLTGILSIINEIAQFLPDEASATADIPLSLVTALRSLKQLLVEHAYSYNAAFARIVNGKMAVQVADSFFEIKNQAKNEFLPGAAEADKSATQISELWPSLEVLLKSHDTLVQEQRLNLVRWKQTRGSREKGYLQDGEAAVSKTIEKIMQLLDSSKNSLGKDIVPKIKKQLQSLCNKASSLSQDYVKALEAERTAYNKVTESISSMQQSFERIRFYTPQQSAKNTISEVKDAAHLLCFLATKESGQDQRVPSSNEIAKPPKPIT